MKTRILALMLVVLAAGCGQNATPEVTPQASQSATQKAQICAHFYSPLPGDLHVEFPFHLRSDRIFTNKKDKLRRRVVLEMLGGASSEAFESASQSLVAAGYKAKGTPKGSAEKKLSQRFTKKGQPAVALVASADVGKKPANPDSTGLVYFEWTPRGAKAAITPTTQ